MKDEAESFKQKSQQLPDFEATRDRILSGLKVGKQSPEYKRTKAAIDRFIAEGVQQSSEQINRNKPVMLRNKVV